MSKVKSNSAVALREIVDDVFGSDMMSNVRSRENVDARRVFCFILKDEGNTNSSIGRFLNKDHATVLHYVRTFQGLAASDPSFSKKYDDCLASYTGNKKHIADVDVDTKEVVFLKETVKMLKNDVATLNIEKDWLKKENETLNEKTKYFNSKNKNIYELINLRTKPGTEELIQKKLNTLFNGVYSEEIISYTVGGAVSNGGKL